MGRTSAGISRLVASGTFAGVAMLAVTACSPSSAPAAQPEDGKTVELGISDADYSLDALIAAAKKEQPIVVLDTTAKDDFQRVQDWQDFWRLNMHT